MKISRIARWGGQIDDAQEAVVASQANNTFMQIYYNTLSQFETDAQRLFFIDTIITLLNEQRDKMADAVVINS